MKRILLIADATRARIFTYEQHQAPDGPHEELREEKDLVDSERRKRASDLFSDSSGGNHNGPHGYSFDDHRKHHLEQLDAEFAAELAGAIEPIARERGYHNLLVVTSSRMIAPLRAALEPLKRILTITELERDYTKLATAELRDHLAALDLLPPRPRLAFADR
jgi:protein required for attachment to host cells